MVGEWWRWGGGKGRGGEGLVGGGGESGRGVTVGVAGDGKAGREGCEGGGVLVYFLKKVGRIGDEKQGQTKPKIWP